MGLYLSRLSVALCGIWTFNFANDFIKSYRHKKIEDTCLCYSCYNVYRNSRMLLYSGFLSVFPDILDKFDFKLFI
jgi:hypothetical protein|uniref:Uncharacterized protein n=1 Tax=viral metagenome TaxID=1070528 RepID=A0A6C0BE26_9ZZZZ